MTNFEQIKEIVREYQEEADRHFQDYSRKMERAKKRYSQDAFAEESKKIWYDADIHLGTTRDIAKKQVDLIVEDIKNDFHKWMIKPINGDLIQTLNCIRNFEIGLGIEELRSLEKEAKKSFFGSRIFSEIAKENGYYVKTPDSKTFMEALLRVRDNAVTAIVCYAGCSPNFIGRDLLEEEKAVYSLVMASNFLTKNDCIEEAQRLWGQNDIPVDYRLTKEEERRLYDLVKNVEDKLERQERIKQLSEIESDFLDKLPLMDDNYKEAIENYLDTGNIDCVYEDNSQENISGYGK